MNTRTGKIARLPKEIREQLNRRLENGHTARTILPWLNALPETKQILTEQFESKPIRAQNLSEWKKGGYQDWLQQQQRIDWFDHFCENEVELAKHENCGDTFEAMSRIFIVEIGQSIAALRNIKDPRERSHCLQNLAREFSRLQNAFNFSRKTQLAFDKHNGLPAAELEIEDDELEEDRSVESTEARTSPSPPRSGGEGRGEVVLRAQGDHQNLAKENAPLGAPASRRHVPANSPEPETPKPAAAPPPSTLNSGLCPSSSSSSLVVEPPPFPPELPTEKSDQIPPTPPPPPITPQHEPQHHYQPAPPKPPVQKYFVHSIPTRRHRLRYIEG